MAFTEAGGIYFTAAVLFKYYYCCPCLKSPWGIGLRCVGGRTWRGLCSMRKDGLWLWYPNLGLVLCGWFTFCGSFSHRSLMERFLMVSFHDRKQVIIWKGFRHLVAVQQVIISTIGVGCLGCLSPDACVAVLPRNGLCFYVFFISWSLALQSLEWSMAFLFRPGPNCEIMSDPGDWTSSSTNCGWKVPLRKSIRFQ